MRKKVWHGNLKGGTYLTTPHLQPSPMTLYRSLLLCVLALGLASCESVTSPFEELDHIDDGITARSAEHAVLAAEWSSRRIAV